MRTITEYRQKRDRIERLCHGDDITAICRQLDREADQRGDQESGYGSGRYWVFFHCCRVRLDGAGFRVDDDPAI